MQRIIEHVKRFIDIPADQETEMLSYLLPGSFPKKSLLLEEGQRCNDHFFVLKGCLRLFYIDERGNDRTVQFALENWWLTDYEAFGRQKKAHFSIQAIEASEVLVLSFQKQEALLAKFPALERYFRLVYQKAYAASQFRIKYLFDYSREEIYHHFNDRFPEFSLRIPQHLLASYLNMTPEYLSEIKARKHPKH